MGFGRRGGTAPGVTILPERGVVSGGVRTMLSWGAPNSYGFEIDHRNPVRSADSMGNALPPVAEELQPLGFWKAQGGHPGGIVPDTGVYLLCKYS